MCGIINLLLFHHQLMMSIIQLYQTLQANVHRLEAQAQRAPGSVAILAVSKGQPVEKIMTLYDAGQQSFGENYVDEALSKISALSSKQIVWHFIGRIQGRKCPAIAEHFDWVHGLCRLKEAQRLNDSRPSNKPPLNVCIQVNIENSDQKNGVSIDELSDFCHEVLAFKSLRLRGLMVFPDFHSSESEQRQIFQQARNLYDQLNKAPFDWDTLSMGMSQDYPSAILEGSTLIRIGQQLFGPRAI